MQVGSVRKFHKDFIPSLGVITCYNYPGDLMCRQAVPTARMTMQPARLIKPSVSCPTNEWDHMFINQNAYHLACSYFT
jgi:hypothetical protein